MLITTPSRGSAVSSGVDLQDGSVIARLAPGLGEIAGVAIARRAGENIVVVGAEVVVGAILRDDVGGGISGLKVKQKLRFSHL